MSWACTSPGRSGSPSPPRRIPLRKDRSRSPPCRRIRRARCRTTHRAARRSSERSRIGWQPLSRRRSRGPGIRRSPPRSRIRRTRSRTTLRAGCRSWASTGWCRTCWGLRLRTSVQMRTCRTGSSRRTRRARSRRSRRSARSCVACTQARSPRLHRCRRLRPCPHCLRCPQNPPSPHFRPFRPHRPWRRRDPPSPHGRRLRCHPLSRTTSPWQRALPRKARARAARIAPPLPTPANASGAPSDPACSNACSKHTRAEGIAQGSGKNEDHETVNDRPGGGRGGEVSPSRGGSRSRGWCEGRGNPRSTPAPFRRGSRS